MVFYDGPCSGLDPISTAKVEEAMMELIEIDDTKTIFTAP